MQGNVKAAMVPFAWALSTALPVLVTVPLVLHLHVLGACYVMLRTVTIYIIVQHTIVVMSTEKAKSGATG